jgi:hypothetical protein
MLEEYSQHERYWSARSVVVILDSYATSYLIESWIKYRQNVHGEAKRDYSNTALTMLSMHAPSNGQKSPPLVLSRLMQSNTCRPIPHAHPSRYYTLKIMLCLHSFHDSLHIYIIERLGNAHCCLVVLVAEFVA